MDLRRQNDEQLFLERGSKRRDQGESTATRLGQQSRWLRCSCTLSQKQQQHLRNGQPQTSPYFGPSTTSRSISPSLSAFYHTYRYITIVTNIMAMGNRLPHGVAQEEARLAAQNRNNAPSNFPESSRSPAPFMEGDPLRPIPPVGAQRVRCECCL